MISLGLRATPHEVWYAVASSTDNNIELLACSKVVVPISLNFPEQLNYIRKTFKDIIVEYKIEVAGIRVTEVSAQTLNIGRISLEAILQELFSSSTVTNYFSGQISNITAKLNVPRDGFKKIIRNEEPFTIVNNFNKYNANEKEAILVSIAAFNI